MARGHVNFIARSLPEGQVSPRPSLLVTSGHGTIGMAQPWEGEEKPRKYWNSHLLQGQQFGAVRGDTAPGGG